MSIIQRIREGILGKKAPVVDSGDYYNEQLNKREEMIAKQKAKARAKEYYQEKPNILQRITEKAQAARKPSVRQANIIASQGGIRIPRRKSRTGGKGRPRGPSGKYIIPGRGAVGVYEYRAWKAQQNVVNKMEASKQAQMMQQQMQQSPIQKPIIVQSQPQQQPQGVNLTGGFELLSVNMNKTVGGTKKSVWDVDTPSDYGDYYTEPDFLSGKQTLRRRITNMPKW